MARKAKRDLTMEEQLARGPLDLPFLMLVLMLMGIGLVMLFSASYYTAYRDSTPAVNHNPYYYILHQAAYAAAGLVGMYIISRINYQHFRWMAPLALGVSIVLLVICYIPGLNAPINKVRRWLRLFLVAGPTYQPSEIAKVAVVLFFAARLSKRDTEKKLRFTKRTGTGRTLNWLEKIGFLELVPYGAVLLVVLGLIVKEPHVSGALLVAVAAAAVLVATLWMPVLQISGNSMSPTLTDGEIVVSWKGSSWEPGDIIAFYYENKILVKRVIAGPGDWVNIDEDGTVYINDVELHEPYLVEKALGDCNIALPYQVPESKIFVMGDHRSVSLDSRNTVLGCVAYDQIVGRLVIRVWPYEMISLI